MFNGAFFRNMKEKMFGVPRRSNAFDGERSTLTEFDRFISTVLTTAQDFSMSMQKLATLHDNLFQLCDSLYPVGMPARTNVVAIKDLLEIFAQRYNKAEEVLQHIRDSAGQASQKNQTVFAALDSMDKLQGLLNHYDEKLRKLKEQLQDVQRSGNQQRIDGLVTKIHRNEGKRNGHKTAYDKVTRDVDFDLKDIIENRVRTANYLISELAELYAVAFDDLQRVLTLLREQGAQLKIQAGREGGRDSVMSPGRLGSNLAPPDAPGSFAGGSMGGPGSSFGGPPSAGDFQNKGSGPPPGSSVGMGIGSSQFGPGGASSSSSAHPGSGMKGGMQQPGMGSSMGGGGGPSPGAMPGGKGMPPGPQGGPQYGGPPGGGGYQPPSGGYSPNTPGGGFALPGREPSYASGGPPAYGVSPGSSPYNSPMAPAQQASAWGQQSPPPPMNYLAQPPQHAGPPSGNYGAPPPGAGQYGGGPPPAGQYGGGPSPGYGGGGPQHLPPSGYGAPPPEAQFAPPPVGGARNPAIGRSSDTPTIASPDQAGGKRKKKKAPQSEDFGGF
ncbi:unnamed protein product [Amoebophrya sp. A25]|nr:unnamed protein product [Amoebophrya sp. A25]|eukprot:GSA25T00011782001.1